MIDNFVPRLASGGRVCCSHADALCSTCIAYHGYSEREYRALQRRGLQHLDDQQSHRVHEITSAPDPYRVGLAAMRAASGGSLP